MDRYPVNNNDGAYALVFGILSLLCCGVIFGPLAISKGSKAGDGLGTAGMILGILGLVFWGIGFLAKLVFGGF
jgi:hypothetical protein